MGALFTAQIMVSIRKAKIEDVATIMKLVVELAVFEKAGEKVINTEAQMLRDGFGANPAFGCFLATENDNIVGMALYYYRYSTWKGKRIYLEDLIVNDKHRNKGIGKLLFDTIIEEGKNQLCTGMMWQVLDWNKEAIGFYDKYNAQYEDEWLNCHLDF